MESSDTGDTTSADGICCFCGTLLRDTTRPKGNALPGYLNGDLREAILATHESRYRHKLSPGDVQRICPGCSSNLSKCKVAAEKAARVARSAPGTSTSEKTPEVCMFVLEGFRPHPRL